MKEHLLGIHRPKDKERCLPRVADRPAREQWTQAPSAHQQIAVNEAAVRSHVEDNVANFHTVKAREPV